MLWHHQLDGGCPRVCLTPCSQFLLPQRSDSSSFSISLTVLDCLTHQSFWASARQFIPIPKGFDGAIHHWHHQMPLTPSVELFHVLVCTDFCGIFLFVGNFLTWIFVSSLGQCLLKFHFQIPHFPEPGNPQKLCACCNEKHCSLNHTRLLAFCSFADFWSMETAVRRSHL